MRTHVRVAWRAGAALAFVATAALAVILSRGAPVPAALTAAGGAQTADRAAASPRCTTSSLEIWLGVAQENASGYVRYPLEFTNVSSTTCALSGYPTVSAYRAGEEGRGQIGNAAGRDASATVRQVLLAPGATAHTEGRLAAAGDFPAARCKPVAAQELRVFPPGQPSARYIPYPFAACSATGPGAPVFLVVQPIQRGTGIPGHPGV
ncbi:MAG: DUF4232 domain-containing protein [Streptosporangiaceae bacterium]|nr:DUF4232 domain-containing protein [Streptosporangiaceae bacterium]MBV9858181.1 DUF4232 domain-containing protein [Streptosporangiaceae bacterium]